MDIVKPKCATFTHLVKVQLINFDRLISGDQPTPQRHEWPALLRNIRKPPMNDEDHLWSLEEKFWLEGLDSARHMTAKGAVFVFPYPVGMLQGEALWQEKSVAQRWRTVSMTQRYFKRANDIAVLAYHVSAERADIPIYGAICTSSYVQDNQTWLRVVHQQTLDT